MQEPEFKIIIKEPCEIEYKMFGTGSEIIKLKAGDYFISKGKIYSLWRGKEDTGLRFQYQQMKEWANYFSGNFRSEMIAESDKLF